MKATKSEILTDLSNGTQIGFISALLELSKTEGITGKIAYNCGRNLTAFSNALKDCEKARIIILESKALKEENGKAKTTPVLKEEGKNEDGTPKMVTIPGANGQPQMKYLYESIEIEQQCISEIGELEKLPLDISIYPIPASEIIELGIMKNGGTIVFGLGEIIDHDK